MDVFTAISQRSSVRAYKVTPVEEDKLKKILEAARLSPSSSNRQEWKFIVVKNKETRKKLANAAFVRRKTLGSDLNIDHLRTERKIILFLKRARKNLNNQV